MITISVYSGRCDLCDTVEIHGIEEIINKYKIYYCDQILPLEVKKKKDLIPYYPFLVYEMGSNKETGGTIHLSSRSYVDEEEKEQLQWILNDALRYWNKYKRQKKSFDKEEVLKQITIFSPPRDYEIEIVDRVAKLGKKATIDGIHKPMHDYYRQKLYDEMVNNGWGEDQSYIWCFGFNRWIDKIDKNKSNDDTVI